jgi:hypothetical protein
MLEVHVLHGPEALSQKRSNSVVTRQYHCGIISCPTSFFKTSESGKIGRSGILEQGQKMASEKQNVPEIWTETEGWTHLMLGALNG